MHFLILLLDLHRFTLHQFRSRHFIFNAETKSKNGAVDGYLDPDVSRS